MDLKQTKLTRNEWESIEVPISQEEREIVKMIHDGYFHLDIKINKTMSMISFLKMENSKELDTHLYVKYFEPVIQKTIQKYGSVVLKDTTLTPPPTIKTIYKIKSIDNVRLQNLESNIDKNREIIYEFILLDHVHQLYRAIFKKHAKYAFHLYTLFQLRKNAIVHINSYVQKYIDELIEYVNQHTDLSQIIGCACEFIEKNQFILKYSDKKLFPHQRQLFSVFSSANHAKTIPKLILYNAPTGTGKTLSPLGLIQEYCVIFVCVARHIGLSLAKTALSMQHKIAFAFGCETASDIRLHNYAASTYIKNKKSGGIGKIDNSDGSLVQLMICDVKSYKVAMNYMLAFKNAENIILYWDEPTISMDYNTHELHKTIHENWKENKIPNVVFSCATLPQEHEIVPVLMDFREKFMDEENSDVIIQTINSYDCKKSIPILTKEGYCAMPHTLFPKYEDLLECVKICESNKTLLRYFDLAEIVKFVSYINKSGFLPEGVSINDYFQHISAITMDSMKLYYLELLKKIPETHWETIHTHFLHSMEGKFAVSSSSSSKGGTNHSKELCRTNSVDISSPVVSQGILITTSDAYTLTDGPTIFLCEEVSKIGNFYIQQSRIPNETYQSLLQKIIKNNELAGEINKLEKIVENIELKFSKTGEGGGGDAKKMDKKFERHPEIMKIQYEIEKLRNQVMYLSMDEKYIPNTNQHQKIWAPLNNCAFFENAFIPTIGENRVKEIMGMSIDTHLKILLLLGIGMFFENADSDYLETMKDLALKQELYMIIASSDYVYGTNYNFCHGFIGKDMTNMTKQKTLQCMGRIGRSSIQQTYTIRFRENSMIYQLFQQQKEGENLEAENMCKLFVCDDLI